VAAGIAALTDEDHLRKSHELNEVGRPQLENFYNEVGLSYVPTYANFHLVDLGIDCLAACKQFQQRGVIVRPMKGYGFPTHVRVSIGTSSENDHWIQVCSEVINKSAVKA
jgi:histidinol-phosphate aminotransferase